LSALLATLIADDNRRLLAAAVSARHGQVYFQAISPGGQSIVAPSLIPTRDAARLLGGGPVTLIGSGAPAVAADAAGLDIIVRDARPAPEVAWVARLGLVADPVQAPPKPLYLRGPDARPQHEARLPRR
jgi:tRNA A37 threonylcarbamoyladenosine modification protein TsaB